MTVIGRRCSCHMIGWCTVCMFHWRSAIGYSICLSTTSTTPLSWHIYLILWSDATQSRHDESEQVSAKVLYTMNDIKLVEYHPRSPELLHYSREQACEPYSPCWWWWRVERSNGGMTTDAVAAAGGLPVMSSEWQSWVSSATLLNPSLQLDHGFCAEDGSSPLLRCCGHDGGRRFFGPAGRLNYITSTYTVSQKTSPCLVLK